VLRSVTCGFRTVGVRRRPPVPLLDRWGTDPARTQEVRSCRSRTLSVLPSVTGTRILRTGSAKADLAGRTTLVILAARHPQDEVL
jgi:hypothetical protein